MAEVLVLVDAVDGTVKKATFELLTAAKQLGEPAAVVVGAPGTASAMIARRWAPVPTGTVDFPTIRPSCVRFSAIPRAAPST